MNRFCLTAAACVSVLCSLGCCYRPGAINPYNGIAYGGRWEPMAGGPLDATACYGPNYGWPNVAANCWNPCDPCPMPVAGPYMAGSSVDCCDGAATSYPQTFAPGPQIISPGTESVPGGMRPVPDPNIKPSAPKSGGATTWVVPQHIPAGHYPQPAQASNVPYVQAH